MMSGFRSRNYAGLVATTCIAGGLSFAAPNMANSQDKPEDFANAVVNAGTESIMSRDQLDTGSVRWSGAEISPKPVEDATVAIVPCPMMLAVCQGLYKDAKAAAAAIGWETLVVDTKGDPAATQRAVDAAINRGVQCVLMLGSPSRDIRAQIQRGKEKDIAFVAGFSDDPRDYGGDVGFGLDQASAGKLLGAYVVANGGGKIIVFNAPAFPQLAERLQGFKDYIAEHGGDTAEVLEEVEFNVGAGAPDLITKMQAMLTKYPKDSFQWVIAPYDEAVVPLLATARQRDRSEIKALGFDGADVALQSISQGTGQSATINWGLEWVAWAGIDECNRAMNGADVGVNTDFPIQLTTASNATPGARYDPGFDFKTRYQKLWGDAR